VTFSDSTIVKLINERFEVAWEAVAPVRIVNFDLGGGRSLRGTISGEMALYFCTPDGKVFDILPALHSPAATRLAMEEALAFYESVDGKVTSKACRKFHQERLDKGQNKRFPIIRQDQDQVGRLISMQKTREGIQKSKDAINEAEDGATGTMRSLASKSLLPASNNTENITIVRPGGRGYYRWEVDQRFTSKAAWSITPQSDRSRGRTLEEVPPSLKTPDEWSKELFETILQQPLIGGETTYDSNSLEAIRIIGE